MLLTSLFQYRGNPLSWARQAISIGTADAAVAVVNTVDRIQYYLTVWRPNAEQVSVAYTVTVSFYVAAKVTSGDLEDDIEPYTLPSCMLFCTIPAMNVAIKMEPEITTKETIPTKIRKVLFRRPARNRKGLATWVASVFEQLLYPTCESTEIFAHVFEVAWSCAVADGLLTFVSFDGMLIDCVGNMLVLGVAKLKWFLTSCVTNVKNTNTKRYIIVL